MTHDPPRRFSLLDDPPTNGYRSADDTPRTAPGTPLSRPPRGPSTRPAIHPSPDLAPPAARGRRAPPAPSAIVYGESRSLVNLVLYGLGSQANPRFLWLDIRSKSEPRSQWDPVRMGWLDERRVWSTDPEYGLVPDASAGDRAIFDVVRADEPPVMLSRLAEFLRLPPTIQEILGELSPSGESNVLAVANVDRISDAFPAKTLAPILSAFVWARCALYVAFVGPARPVVEHFSHVVRVDGVSPSNWREAQVHFERGEFPGGPSAGSSVLVRDLPYLERVFRQASP